MQMFINKNIWRTAAVMMASAALLVSCVELEENQTEAVGYLVAPSLDIDVTVDDLLLTKTLDFTVETPSIDEISFKVTDNKGKVRYEDEGLWTEPLILPAGSYTVEASYGENGFGAPYFYKIVTGTIDNLEYENLGTINVPLENSLVRVSVSDELEKHFTPTSVSFNDGEYTASCGEWVYVPSDVILELAVSGSNKAGTSAVYIHTFESKTSPRMAYDVVCGTTDSNWPSMTMQEISSANAWASRIYITGSPNFTGEISQANMDKVIYEAIPADSEDWDSLAGASEVSSPVIKGLTPGTTYKVRARIGGLISSNSVEVTPTVDGLSVSAYHTTNAAGELDGTDVETVFSKSADVKEAITKWTISLYPKTGESEAPLRSWSSLDKSDGSDEKVWPYLPTGNGESYVIKASAEMDGQTYDFNDISVTGLSAPDFSLTLSAYTSYDKYACLNGVTVKDLDSATGANNCEPSTLYNAGAKWSISTDIMKNSNYSKTIAIYIDGNATGRTRTETSWNDNFFYQDIAGLSWASHTHKVAFTFDNKTVTSAEHTHHITGLPYNVKKDVPSSSEWSILEQKATFGDDYVQFSGTFVNPSIASPTFYIPSDLNVTVYTKISKGGTATYHSAEISQYSSSGNVGEPILESNSGQEVSAESTMTSTYNRWRCKVTGTLVAGIYVRLHYLTILYK